MKVKMKTLDEIIDENDVSYKASGCVFFRDKFYGIVKSMYHLFDTEIEIDEKTAHCAIKMAGFGIQDNNTYYIYNEYFINENWFIILNIIDIDKLFNDLIKDL